MGMLIFSNQNELSNPRAELFFVIIRLFNGKIKIKIKSRGYRCVLAREFAEVLYGQRTCPILFSIAHCERKIIVRPYLGFYPCKTVFCLNLTVTYCEPRTTVLRHKCVGIRLKEHTTPVGLFVFIVYRLTTSMPTYPRYVKQVNTTAVCVY